MGTDGIQPVTATLPCSVATREAEEDPAGTATEALSWVAVLAEGPWQVPALDGVPDLGSVAKGLPGVKVVLAEPAPGRGRKRRGPRLAAIMAGTLPGRTWRRDLHGEAFDVVRLLHEPAVREALSQGRDPGVGRPVRRPAVLVCAHGAKDDCCGRWGPEAATAMRDAVRQVRRPWGRGATADVMLSSHLGGHRFAPTAVVLPWGLMFGGLGPRPENLALAVSGTLTGRPIVEGYRGRSTWPPPVQVAEAQARRRLSELGVAAGPDDVVPVTSPDDWSRGEDVAGAVRHVDLVHPIAGTIRMAVRRGTLSRPRPVSCGGTAVASPVWVAEAVAGSPGSEREAG